MNLFLFSLILWVSTSVAYETKNDSVSEATIRKVLRAFPSTEEQIESFANDALQDFLKAKEKFNAQDRDKLNFQNVVMGWDRLMNAFIWKQALLTFFYMKSEEKALLQKAENEAEHLAQKIVENLLDEKSIGIVLAYAKEAIENPRELNPSEMYMLGSLIKSIAEGLPTSPKEKEASALYAKIAERPLLAFTYVLGNAASKELPEDKNVSILNWNVCCFDGGLSMLFGGVLPWEYRIDRIAEFLKTSQADIICLQELFSLDAVEALFSKLKDEYAHFYIHIGPKISGFNARELGVPSGLFVASKYRLENPKFYPYSPEETPSNRGYGFFSAVIEDQVRLVTTHLQPGSDGADIKFRSAQAKAVVNTIDDKMPSFFCGDFNIERKSKEYESEIAPFFINKNTSSEWTACELRDYWSKAKENAAAFQALGLPTELIDYFLTFKKKPGTILKTSLLIANDPLHPPEALSDHQAMISIIKI